MSTLENQRRRATARFLISVATTALLIAPSMGRGPVRATDLELPARAEVNQASVVVVSAASYEAVVAPDSIAAAFGSRLATTVCVGTDVDPASPGIQLPTQLCGTSIEVNGRLAGLFFVSPGQVNLAIPPNTEIGQQSVVARAGDGTVSNGAVQVRDVAPAVFTANSDGKGVPAALLVRVRSTGQQLFESPFQCAQGCTTRPISLGPEGEHVFLILFLSGIRRAADLNGDGNVAESVHVVMGGTEVVPAFAGRQGEFLGLDQVNVELTRTLLGRGRVNLAVVGNGFDASNLCEIEVDWLPGSAPPVVQSFTPNPALAGQTITINGMGLSGNPGEMLVRIAGIEGRLVSASGAQASVQVPFGVRSGAVSVHTPLGEGIIANSLAIRTSISGAIETTNRQPIGGVSVKIVGSTVSARTEAEGAFLLPDVLTSSTLIEVDGTATPAAPSFAKMLLRTTVFAIQDNQFVSPISLQQVTGDGLIVGSSSPTFTSISVSAPSSPDEVADSVQTGNVTFEVPSNATSHFTDGATTGTLALTLVNASRMPLDFPEGFFSSAAVQITPFGVILNPGGKLTFPNPEGYAAGTQVKLFRLDQTAASPSLGTFVETGTAIVSADGQRIETTSNAITETSYYFVAGAQPKTTLIGRVVDGDGVTPVRLAIVRARGQTTFTDGNGGFILSHVPVKSANDQIAVEASYMRPSGRVDRTQRGGINAIVSGVTAVVPELILPLETSNRPPVIIAASNLAINASETRDFYFTAYDPDPGQTVQVGVSGASFASVVKGAGNSYSLHLSTGANDAGTLTLTLTATDSLGAGSSQNISLRVNTASIGCGQTLAGNITQPAQQDTYTFSGNAGEVVRLAAVATTGFLCAQIELYDPALKAIRRTDCNKETGLLTLPATGKYVILVRDDNLTDGGAYAVSLVFVTGQCSKSLTCGQPIAGDINSRAKQDTYTFNGNAGEIVRIAAVAVTGFLCAQVELYDPALRLIKKTDCSKDTGLLTLPATGKYVVLVRDDNLVDGGAYAVSLVYLDGRCGTGISCGQTLAGNINSRAKQDTYTFNGNAGEIVRIAAVAVTGFLCAQVELYDPSLRLIKTTECSKDTGLLTLPATGKYVILVRDDNLVDGGEYAVSLVYLDGRCGTSISCGQTLAGNINSRAKQDTYTFNGNAGEIVRIAAVAVTGFLCAQVELYDPSLRLIKTTECSKDTGPLTLPATGKYVILVRDDNLVDGGEYAVSLVYLDGRCGTSISCGQTLAGNINSRAKQDTYTFNGNAGEIVRIAAVAVTGFLCAQVELYDPSLRLIKTTECSKDTGLLTLPATGKYVILVRDDNLVDGGAYALSLVYLDGRCGTSISCGQTLARSIGQRAQQDTYTFSGNTGQMVRVAAVASSGFLCAQIELYDPTINLIKMTACNTDTGFLTLSASGRYVVVVRDDNLIDGGNYSVSLTCVGSISLRGLGLPRRFPNSDLTTSSDAELFALKPFGRRKDALFLW